MLNQVTRREPRVFFGGGAYPGGLADPGAIFTLCLILKTILQTSCHI